MLAAQRSDRRMIRCGFQPAPELSIERDLGLKGRDLRQRRIVRRTQFWRIGHAGEMRDLGPRLIEQFRGAFQRQKRVRVVRLGEIDASYRGERRVGRSQSRVNGQLDLVGRKLGPPDVK